MGNMHEFVKRIKDIMEQGNGHPADVCMALYKTIAESNHPAELLRSVLEYSQPIGDIDDDNPVDVTKEEMNTFVQQNYKYITQYTRLLARKNLSKETFYERLYADLFDPGNGMLPDSDKTKGILLELLANHVRFVPYYQLSDDADVTEEQFNKSVDHLTDDLQNAKHILRRDFETKTAKGIQIYRLMETINDETDKIVFLSLVLGMVQSEATQEK